jgi:AcrR family transcriptional regulator
MPRHRREEGLRDRILDACETHLDHGPAAITAREIAMRAGVSNGTLYHYFPSIDDLLLAVATRAADRQQGAFGDPSQGVRTVLARLFDINRRDTVLPWLRQRAATSPELASALQRYDEQVNAAYTSALRATAVDIGLRDDADTEAAVEIVRALAEGFQLRIASGTLVIDPDRFVATVITAITAAWFEDTGA